MITRESGKQQVEALHQEGVAFAAAFGKKQETEPFEVGYQRLYSRTLPLMKDLAPDRYDEFQSYYFREWRMPETRLWDFVVRDYILGRTGTVTGDKARSETLRCFTSQLAILRSVGDRIESTQLDTADQAERSLQLALLDTANGLIKINERAAGALAGVVLETHLRKLATSRKLRFLKKSPSPRELADMLKEAQVLDIPVHSQVIWIADISERSKAEAGAPPNSRSAIWWTGPVGSSRMCFDAAPKRSDARGATHFTRSPARAASGTGRFRGSVWRAAGNRDSRRRRPCCAPPRAARRSARSRR